jgi:hypothetical protein
MAQPIAVAWAAVLASIALALPAASAQAAGVRLICNRFDPSGENIAYATRKPRRCDIWRANWGHYQSLQFRKATWRRWGTRVAVARVTVIYSMGYHERFRLKAYGRRRDCTGERFVYTRVKVSGRPHVWRPNTCPD